MAFWEEKALDEMSREEWESLCDGCGKCCLHKLEDDVSGELHFTRVACQLLDRRTCRCSDYEDRHSTVPDCVVLTPENLPAIDWLPETCAYLRVARGAGLPAWHPLRSADPDGVVSGGHSVSGWCVSEKGAGDLWEQLVDPARIHAEPRTRRR